MLMTDIAEKTEPPILFGLMSVDTTARRVGTTRQTVSRWIHGLSDGRRLKARRIGGRRYVHPDDLQAFLADEPVHAAG